jgi:Asp-tRNA(Asn)/Glu-tRNA(Gln) amidotransferase A subunit family amidase
MTPGGSGAAVAAGMCPFAIGSDGGGSIRIPSAHCGVFGMKASMGRVPLYPGCRDERYPGVSGWESLEHIGPISRTVADSALMLSVIAGPDDRDRHSLPAPAFDWLQCLEGGIRGLKVSYSPDWGYAAVDPAVRRIAGEAARVFETDLGCTVDEASPGASCVCGLRGGSAVAGQAAALAGQARTVGAHAIRPSAVRQPSAAIFSRAAPVTGGRALMQANPAPGAQARTQFL